MKILYTTVTNSAQSGATHQLFVMAEMARELGYSAIVAVPPGPTPATSAELVHVPMSAPRLVRSVGYQARYFGGFGVSIVRLAQLIRNREVDIVHANEIVDLQPAYAARLARRPLVWAIRAGFSTTPGLTKAFSRIAVRNAAKIIPVSNSVRTSFFGWYDNADQKIEVLYDAPRFTERVDPGKAQGWRDRLGLGVQTRLIVLVSKLMPQKGHRVLFDAAPTIFSRFPDARILIVGGEADGKEAYAAELRSLSLADSRIQLFGQADDVPGLMAASDVVVHCPVFRDPLPGVVIEGMVAARPVVGTRIGGIPEIVVDGITGRLAEANDPADLAEKVIAVLSLSREDRNAMGERGRERALTVFSRDNYLQGLRRIYEGLGPSS